MKKQVLNEEFKRMQKLAGIIKEDMGDNFTPDWRDYEGYELLLEDYFDMYDLNESNPEDFWTQVDEGDMMNNLAFDIAKRSGFEGDFGSLIDEEEFNSYCNALALIFILDYGADTFIVDRNNPKFKNAMSEAEAWFDRAEKNMNT